MKHTKVTITIENNEVKVMVVDYEKKTREDDKILIPDNMTISEVLDSWFVKEFVLQGYKKATT